MTGTDDPDLSIALTRSTATLRNPDLLYIIHGNGNFSEAVHDTVTNLKFNCVTSEISYRFVQKKKLNQIG